MTGLFTCLSGYNNMPAEIPQVGFEKGSVGRVECTQTLPQLIRMKRFIVQMFFLAIFNRFQQHSPFSRPALIMLLLSRGSKGKALHTSYPAQITLVGLRWVCCPLFLLRLRHFYKMSTFCSADIFVGNTPGYMHRNWLNFVETNIVVFSYYGICQLWVFPYLFMIKSLLLLLIINRTRTPWCH